MTGSLYLLIITPIELAIVILYIQQRNQGELVTAQFEKGEDWTYPLKIVIYGKSEEL